MSLLRFRRLSQRQMLWKALIDRGASPVMKSSTSTASKAACLDCGTNLRSIILARAIGACFQYPGLFRDFVKTEGEVAASRSLEINEAG